MEINGGSEKEGVHPEFLDLKPNGCFDEQNRHGYAEEKRLELRLGLPGQGWSNSKDSTKKSKERGESFLSLGYGSSISPPNVILNSSSSSQERSAPPPAVGWPPVRSFRRNLTATPSNPKPAPTKVISGEKLAGDCLKCQFVKINMDGVPIGRKVDLAVNDSYEKLSSAVDELFRGLLAVEKLIGGLMDGTGEYTLVYEDNEGDQLLAGDVPWPLFVSTVKRLRVLKSSEIAVMNARARKIAPR